MFSNARDTGMTPREFVDSCRKQNKLSEYSGDIDVCVWPTLYPTTVSGIGHKIKSVNNPDLRVELVKEYVHKNFPSHSLLDYALAVEKVTTSKKDTVCC
jgi:ATP citrate (pro-S)-lyase